MRALRALRARHDMVEVLLRRGRLADVPMLNFFSSQLERADTTQVPTDDTTKHETNDKATKAPEHITQNAFRAQVNRVQALAKTSDPMAWVGEVYGKQQWSTSYLASRTTHITKALASSDAQSVQLSGTATAAGGAYTVANNTTTSITGTPSDSDQLPETVQIIASMKDAQHVTDSNKNSSHTNNKDKEGESGVVAAVVPLTQRGVTYEAHNGVLHLKLHDAQATLMPSILPYNVAVTQHVMTAAAYASILGKLEEICALHATHTVRYDALLIRNPATQRRLAQLACFRFGIESLLAYVISDAVEEQKLTTTKEAEKKTEHNDKGHVAEVQNALSHKLDIPLLESVVLNLYAEAALMDGLDDVWAMVHDAAFLLPAQHHRSAPEKVIDYPYLSALLQSPKYVLTSLDGTMKEQALHFLVPLLLRLQPQHATNSNTSNSEAERSESGLRGLFGKWLGMTSGGAVRLAAPHPNLRVATAGLERDLATFLTMIKHQSHGKHNNVDEPSFVIAMAQYVAELIANVAVVCRCTAALNADEEGAGHREWLLTQAFCAASSLRRQKIMDELQSTQAAARVLHRAADLDGYSIHPVELMNAAPARQTKAEANSKADNAATQKATPTEAKGTA